MNHALYLFTGFAVLLAMVVFLSVFIWLVDKGYIRLVVPIVLILFACWMAGYEIWN